MATFVFVLSMLFFFRLLEIEGSVLFLKVQLIAVNRSIFGNKSLKALSKSGIF